MSIFDRFKQRVDVITQNPDLSSEFTSTSRTNKRVYQILNTNIKTLNTYAKYYDDVVNNPQIDNHQKIQVLRDLRVYSTDSSDDEISIRGELLSKISDEFEDRSSFIKNLFIFALALRSNYNLLSGSQYLIDSLPEFVLNNYDEYLKILLTTDNTSLSNPAYGVFVFYSDPVLLDLYLDILNSERGNFTSFMVNEIDDRYDVIKRRIRNLQSSAIKIEALLFSFFRVILELDSSISIYDDVINAFINLINIKINSLDAANFTRILSYSNGEVTQFRDFLLGLSDSEKNEVIRCLNLDVTSTTADEVEEELLVLDTDIEQAVLAGHDVSTTTSSRRGQNRFKRSLIRHSSVNGVCTCAIPGCSVAGENFLIASHIVPWQHSSPTEKVDHNNGLLLCPNHDLLFDLKLFSFDNDGKIVISNRLSDANVHAFHLNSEIRLDLSVEKRIYMSKHLNAMLSGEWNL